MTALTVCNYFAHHHTEWLKSELNAVSGNGNGKPFLVKMAEIFKLTFIRRLQYLVTPVNERKVFLKPLRT